jgi:hypothetical protein
MNYLQEVFTGRCKATHIRNKDKTTDDSSVVHSHSKKWKDLAGFRDEMKTKRYQTRSNHRDGALLNFFIPEENASQAKELLTWRKNTCTGYFSSPFDIYSLNTIKSRLIQNNNRKEPHHDQLLFNHR